LKALIFKASSNKIIYQFGGSTSEAVMKLKIYNTYYDGGFWNKRSGEVYL